VSLGLSAFQIGDAEFKRTLIERSERIAALITIDKVEDPSPFQVAALAALDHVVLEYNIPEKNSLCLLRSWTRRDPCEALTYIVRR